jgi:hypothetical protein
MNSKKGIWGETPRLLKYLNVVSKCFLLVKIKEDVNFNRRHMVNIPRIKICA